MKHSLTAIASAIFALAIPAALAAPVQIECTISVWHTPAGEQNVNEKRVYLFDEAANVMWAHNAKGNKYKCFKVRADTSTIWADCGKVVFSINRPNGEIELNLYGYSGKGSRWSWWQSERGVCAKEGGPPL